MKALGRDERDADLLFRVYRFFRLKNVGDQRPVLVAAPGRGARGPGGAEGPGLRRPHPAGPQRRHGRAGRDAAGLRRHRGRDRSTRSTGEFDDDLLEQIWQQVAILRRERIAHRDLRRANIFRGTDGELWIIDFGFSELAASDRLLQADVAELRRRHRRGVGAERAVRRRGRRASGRKPVGQSLPMLQPLALAGATHKAVAEQKG